MLNQKAPALTSECFFITNKKAKPPIALSGVLQAMEFCGIRSSFFFDGENGRGMPYVLECSGLSPKKEYQSH